MELESSLPVGGSSMDVGQLLRLSEDELFELLGGAFHGAFPGDSYRRGVKFFHAIFDACRTEICADPAVRRFVAEGDRVALAGAVADILLTLYGQVPSATAAALLVKVGVGQLCASCGPESKPGNDR